MMDIENERRERELLMSRHQAASVNHAAELHDIGQYFAQQLGQAVLDDNTLQELETSLHDGVDDDKPIFPQLLQETENSKKRILSMAGELMTLAHTLADNSRIKHLLQEQHDNYLSEVSTLMSAMEVPC
jgi:hypothetical protein